MGSGLLLSGEGTPRIAVRGGKGNPPLKELGGVALR